MSHKWSYVTFKRSLRGLAYPDREAWHTRNKSIYIVYSTCQAMFWGILFFENSLNSPEKPDEAQ